jgi:integrase
VRPRPTQFKVKKHKTKNGRCGFYLEGYSTRRERFSFRNKSEALKEMARRNKELEQFGTQGSVNMTPEERKIVDYCLKKVRPYGVQLMSTAVDEYLPKLDRSLTAKSIAELCQAYERYCLQRYDEGADMGDRHLEGIRETLGKLTPRFGTELICDVQGQQVRSWLRSLELGGRSRNNHLSRLSAMFQWATQDTEPGNKHSRWLPDNPLAKTEFFPVHETEVGILTAAQLKALLAAAHSDLIPFLALGGFAGLRRAEIEKMDWCDVHVEDLCLMVPAKIAKTAKKRMVVMEPNLAAWLKPHVKETGSLVPLSQRTGLPSSKRLELLLDTARKAARITEWPSNCLRHSYGTYMIVKRHDEAYVAEQMGNSVTMVRDHYKILVKPQESERYFNIYPPSTPKPEPDKRNGELSEWQKNRLLAHLQRQRASALDPKKHGCYLDLRLATISLDKKQCQSDKKPNNLHYIFESEVPQSPAEPLQNLIVQKKIAANCRR